VAVLPDSAVGGSWLTTSSPATLLPSPPSAVVSLSELTSSDDGGVIKFSSSLESSFGSEREVYGLNNYMIIMPGRYRSSSPLLSIIMASFITQNN
jgi:hypothetical protein